MQSFRQIGQRTHRTMRGLRNWRFEKKRVVEDCLILSVKDVCTGAGCHSGLHRWRCGDHDLGAIKYEINLRSAERGCLWLWHHVDGAPNCVAISMISTTLHTGGRRWWFICPVTASESSTSPLARLTSRDAKLMTSPTGHARKAGGKSVFGGELTSSLGGTSSYANDSNLQMTAQAALTPGPRQ
jgi:hypothetical protein